MYDFFSFLQWNSDKFIGWESFQPEHGIIGNALGSDHISGGRILMENTIECFLRKF